MVNLTFVGTNLTNGNPDSNSSCVTGFDQAGFIMGTSASLFNVSQMPGPINICLTGLA
jgi:lysophospholipase